MCIHGHFYQPPRENPWLEAIEVQDSADPYHDWNERITAECYEPNAASRILDEEDRIVRIVNNYARINFNFGPTLLVWLEENAPEVYRAVLDADRESADRFGGHGSALAQAYNHIIMPLANRRDKVTQVRWGIRDFEHRFGRRPQGMWLPETAVDLETLEVLAEHDIAFTVLAPHQAARVRRPGEEWREVSDDGGELKRVYRQALPSGRSIALFFYHGPLSRAIAFEGLLRSGENFAHGLLHPFEPGDEPQLVHIATDGETYGHHHRHGDMALAYALHTLESQGLAQPTNYAQFLARHPPEEEVQIHGDTSWSCAHGVERWRSDCGCTTGGPEGWHQGWRAPLREALDWLRDELAPRYEARAGELLRDPWAARNDYIDVILDRSPESVDRFFAAHALRDLTREERVRALKLLELQRHALLMYTSCGWFFNDISRIETVQVLQYAARALQLCRDLFEDLEPGFVERLAKAPSNVADLRDGREVYERLVRPGTVDLAKVAAHYAMSSLFTEYPEEARVYSYRVERKEREQMEAGEAVLALGHLRVTSVITEESDHLTFAVLKFGHHNLSCGVRPFQGEEAYAGLAEEMEEAFTRGDFSQSLRTLDRRFGGQTYSLSSLFRDEQRAILDQVLDTTLDEAEAAYRWIFQHQAPLMRFLKDLGAPLPTAFTQAARFVLNVDLRRALEESEPDLDAVADLLERARYWDVDLDATRLAYVLEQALERAARRFQEEPSFARLARLEAMAELARDLPFDVGLAKAQNAFYRIREAAYPARRKKAEAGDREAAEWVERFERLADSLSVRVA